MLQLDWDNLRTFLTVCRAGGLGQAARVLNVNHTTVGRRVAALEKTIGSRLFERLHGKLALTEDGRNLFDKCEEVCQLIDHAISGADYAKKISEQTVRLGLCEGIATAHIAPALRALCLDASELRIEIVHAAQLIALSRREADLFLGLEQVEVNGIYSEPIGRIDVGLFASPCYLKRRGTPKCNEDLSRYEYVDYLWEFAPDAARGILAQLVPEPNVVVRSATSMGLLQAAVAGCGITAFAVDTALADGRLVQLLPDTVRCSVTVWLSRHESIRERAAIKQLLCALRAIWPQ